MSQTTKHTPMRIEQDKHGAVTVLRPIGPLTEAESQQFKSKVTSVVAASLGRFVVDVSAVPYVDSKGLEALVEVNEQLSQSGQSLKLCGVNETIREVLDLTELASLFENFHDVNDAVRSFL